MTFLSINTWWEALNGTEQIYWGIAIIASGIFIFQLIITFVGLETDLEADIDDGDGFGLISFRTLIAFATFFGWGGVAGLAQGLSAPKVLMIAFLSGFIAMVGLAYALSQLLKLQESGTIDTYKAIAQIGEVYIPIPEAQDGKGKIHVNVQDKIMEFDAISNGQSIPTGTKVKVLDVLNENVMLVSTI